MYAADRGPFHQGHKYFPAYLGQYRIGQNGVDHTAAALQFRAAADDVLNHLRIVGEWNAVIFENPFFDSAKLQPHYIRQHGIAQRIVGDNDQPSQEGGRENPQQRFSQCLGEAFHIRRKLRVTAHIHDEVRADVGREYNQRVFEIDRTSLAIFHPPFVKNLEKDLVYVRVRLFDFIKQYHAVWFSAHRLRQPAALSVAYVTWRSPLERGDRMRFLKFAHIYGYYVLFPAIEGFGQREGRLGFADPGWSGQHEDADRFLRIVQFRPGGINALADHLQRMALSDDAPIHDV